MQFGIDVISGRCPGIDIGNQLESANGEVISTAITNGKFPVDVYN